MTAGAGIPAAGAPLASAPLSGVRPAEHRRWTLRARLIALVVAIAAIALAAVDIVLPLVVRNAQISTEDATLNSAINAVPGQLSYDALRRLVAANPLRGEINWTLVSNDGSVQDLFSSSFADGPSIPPVLTTEPQTVPARNGIGRVRIKARGLQGGGALVVWTSLDGLDANIRRLVLVELLVTGGLLVLLGATAGLIIRRELKPLEAMATAADDIAGGELDRRVDPGDPGTEVGRLGVAFNGMLDGIGGLLEERRHSEDRLRQFVADASHELRTPVAAVRGYTDLYRAGALSDEEAVEKAMARMGFESRRMGALVDDLLTLIQADTEQTLGHDRVDLVQLLTGVIDDAAVIDPSRRWQLAGSSTTAVVLGDRLRLHQLFANLLANIRTHTPPGTTATVSVLPGIDEVAVTVRDNGPGVDDAALGRLFDRFFRVDASRSREHGGTGLGLSIVAAIVRSHGGAIHASHSPGGGLTMTVVLPRAMGTAAVHAPPTTAESDGPAGAPLVPSPAHAGPGTAG